MERHTRKAIKRYTRAVAVDGAASVDAARVREENANNVEFAQLVRLTDFAMNVYELESRKARAADPSVPCG